MSTPAAAGPDAAGLRAAPPRSIAVVGAGLAGARTVAALRARGFDGRITVLGAEGVPPYDRPPLSKELFTRPAPAWLSDELMIDLTRLADDVRLSSTALLLEPDPDGVTVTAAATSASGRGTIPGSTSTVRADAVVLACGSHAVRPWHDALTLHTHAEAADLRRLLLPGRRLVVVGAGWIGAEIAGVAAAEGVEVTVVEATAAPLSAQLGVDIGALTVPWYAAAGVELICGARVASVDAAGVHLEDRRLPADVVLAAVGAAPATGWLRGCLPLTARGAVPVDHLGRIESERGVTRSALPASALSRIRAVGDCADRRSDRFGAVLGSHWSGALSHPELVAASITGTVEPAEDAPYVFSDQLGHHLTLVGVPARGAEVVHRGGPGAPEGWTTLWFGPVDGVGVDGSGGPSDSGRADGSGAVTRDAQVRELLAVLTVDRPRDVGAARRLLGADRAPLLDVVRAGDPTVPLRAAALG